MSNVLSTMNPISEFRNWELKAILEIKFTSPSFHFFKRCKSIIYKRWNGLTKASWVTETGFLSLMTTMPIFFYKWILVTLDSSLAKLHYMKSMVIVLFSFCSQKFLMLFLQKLKRDQCYSVGCNGGLLREVSFSEEIYHWYYLELSAYGNSRNKTKFWSVLLWFFNSRQPTTLLYLGWQFKIVSVVEYSSLGSEKHKRAERGICPWRRVYQI